MVASLDLLIRAVLIHHPVKDGLVDGKEALQPKPLLDHSLIMLASPGRITFRVSGVCLFNGSQQPPCDCLDLVSG